MKNILILILLLFPCFCFSQWTQIGQDIDGEAYDDESGISVDMTGDGNMVVIGSHLHDTSNGQNVGHIRIFQNVGGNWTQVGSDIEGEGHLDGFGNSVAISSDGSIVAAGAYQNDGAGANSGHVRVFENIGGVWTQIGTDIDGEASGDQAGGHISLSSDGSILAIGASGNNGNGTASGHVRVFENIGNVWAQLGQDIDGEMADSSAGSSVKLSSDGSIVAVGEAGNDENGSNSGQVRVFELIGNIWTQIGQDLNGVNANDQFGRSVSLSQDGTVLAVGATEYNGASGGQGRVAIFENVGGVWNQIGSNLDGETSGDSFGVSVDLSSDGSIVAIGGERNTNSGGTMAGHVRIYQNITGNWVQVGQDINGEATFDFSGISISLSQGGDIVAIGAYGHNGSDTDTGQVRVFQNSTLSIDDHTFGDDITMFPNPTFRVSKINLGNVQSNIELIVYNAMGKTILNKRYSNTDEVEIDTQYLSSGIYLIKIISDTKFADLKLVKG